MALYTVDFPLMCGFLEQTQWHRSRLRRKKGLSSVVRPRDLLLDES